MNNEIKKTNKLNNKGFSLVELIIVIAIMAVLIGVLAPQYLRYVERSRVAADTELAASLQNAMEIAASDPAIGVAPAATGDVSTVDNTTDAFWTEVFTVLGETSGTNLIGELQSNGATGITWTYDVTTGVEVTVTGTTIVVD